MMIVNHGGACCGIKTIKGFPEDPEEMMYKESHRPPTTAPEPYFDEEYDPEDDPNCEGLASDRDVMGYCVRSDWSFFYGDLPAEKAWERLDRLIAFCKRERPSHIIEIALAEYGIDEDDYYYDEDDYECTEQNTPWAPYLIERGFKETVSGRNSNSGNIVHVWHLAYENAHEEEAVVAREAE